MSPVPVRGGWDAGKRGEACPLINKSSLSVLFCHAETCPTAQPADEESTPQFSFWRVKWKCQVNKCRPER